MAQLPKDTYIICDPCYVMPDALYDEMVDALAFVGQENSAIINDKEVVCLNTAYGDGTYSSNTHIEFMVDDGMIAAIPLSLCDDKLVKDLLDNEDAILIKDSPLIVSEDRGTLSFMHDGGVIEIYTDPDLSDEDEDDYY